MTGVVVQMVGSVVYIGMTFLSKWNRLSSLSILEVTATFASLAYYIKVISDSLNNLAIRKDQIENTTYILSYGPLSNVC